MIRTAIVGLGNCASSLVQSIHYCRSMGDAAIGVPRRFIPWAIVNAMS